MAQFYLYQQRAIDEIFGELARGKTRLLFQLPTGGGKTVIFSEIVRRFIAEYSKKATILTHRNELCSQTSATLKKLGVKNKVISSALKKIPTDAQCYVAMVETLRNRIKSNAIDTSEIGLVIVDEAHHNAFRKLFKKFPNAVILGVTATPFSADVEKPMNRYYDSLLVGENIASLIESGFLAKPAAFEYQVELNSLITGIHGDFTVSSSNELYGSEAMLELLVSSYRKHADGKKTLIFNNGIATSLKVFEKFKSHGIPIAHLDNKLTDDQRKETLLWFKKTKGAVLTSVSILTTGFDEPSVQAVILNRATTSVTLFHQMIGRGARRLATKKTFTVVDLGNNIQRFGHWHEPIDWQYVFKDPQGYAAQLQYQTSADSGQIAHRVPAALRSQFPNTLEFTFDIEHYYDEVLEQDKKPKTVIAQSIRQHAIMCLENAESASGALELAEALLPEIEWRIKTYVKCLGNTTAEYKKWLLNDYNDRLNRMIKKLFARRIALESNDLVA